MARRIAKVVNPDIPKVGDVYVKSGVELTVAYIKGQNAIVRRPSGFLEEISREHLRQCSLYKRKA